MSERLASCRSCGKTILFAIVTNRQGKPPSRMPLDPSPDPGGNVASYRDATGTRVGRVLGKNGKALGFERLYMPHFATCEKRATRPGGINPPPSSLPPGVTSLNTWRRTRKPRRPGRRRTLGGAS